MPDSRRTCSTSAGSLNGGFSSRVLFNYFGDRISDVGANEAPDIIEEGRGTLDVVLAQRMRGLSLVLALDNLTDTDYELTQTLTSGQNSATLRFGSHVLHCHVRLQRVLRRHDIDKEQRAIMQSFTHPVWDRAGGRSRRSGRPPGCPRIRRHPSPSRASTSR